MAEFGFESYYIPYLDY